MNGDANTISDAFLPAEKKLQKESHTVLVTGGAGYLGSRLCALLLECGYKVIIYDCFLWGITPILPFLGHPNLSVIKGDVCDETQMKAVLPLCDTIVHLAAIVGYPACVKEPELAVEVNELATKKIARNLKPWQQLIFASTGSCYGAVKGTCTEETPLVPLSLYGKTKAESEKCVLGFGGVALRMATLFGVSFRMRLDLLVNDLTYQAIEKGELNLYQGWFRRTFLHVKDAARAFLFAIRNYDSMKGEAFNVGCNELNLTKREVVQKIQQKIPDFTFTEEQTDKDQDKRDYEVSYNKLRKLGFRARESLDSGIEELVQILPLFSEADVRICKNV
uniref:UDP-glucuronic acid decarboxylase 1-like n=1 Tax=Phallusia mammillata TaxID=59560 RepID=A0A6F9DXI6_9ASCI|nr:UDP-glucuronic acid decarboxylase 1-like [Phallusia mammillata]